MWDLPACLWRHKRKLLIAGGVIGGFAFLQSHLKRKFAEWELRQTAELRNQLQRSSHFESTLKACDSVLISFAPKIKETVCNILDVNPILEQLKQKSSNKDLWQQLKILVFAQVLGEMYAQCLLAVLLRVQMSILAGYVYAIRSSNKSDGTNQYEQTLYLSNISNFLTSGISTLLIPIQNCVENVLSSVPLNRPLKLQDVSDILSAVCKDLSEESLLPNISSELVQMSNDTTDDYFLQKMCSETRDVLECADFERVLSLGVERGVSFLMDRLSECYVFLSEEKNNFVNPNDFAAPLARLIPMMYKVFSQHEPSEPGALVHAMLQLEPLNTFAANIYESFSQTEL
ncbi:peroxisomal biogenesis factor 3-like [Uloborus diversus]|uniref:peroxisomal biogenesis factor 3-like n=1 Tax=Uloborus diversus TaxID=327109 RepID=UPI00240A5F37|nr:peroxisomal biogenesis factor 3-like [Uloborus diversus]